MTAYAAFSSRNYRFLLAGTVLSVLSQQMLSIVVSWDLYEATRSAVILGDVGLVQIVPVLLFTLAAGHVADRYRRGRILTITQIATAATGFVLVFAGSHHRTVALIYSCLFLGATARAFQWPASSSILPKIVPLEHLSNAITWNGTGREMANVTGPAIAGLLLAWLGSSAVYVVQTGCAVLALLCFSALRLPVMTTSEGGRGVKDIGEGMRFVFRDKLVLSALSLDLLAVLFGGAVALLPIYADDILHVGATGLGWLRAAPAIGAGAMAFVLAHRAAIRRAGPVFFAVVAGFGAATVVFAISKSPWFSFVLLIAIGALDSVSVVLRSYLVHTRTPDHLRGRVNAVNALFIGCSNQWGAVESGLAAAWLGTVPSVVWGGSATIAVSGLIALIAVQLRRWRIETEKPQATAA